MNVKEKREVDVKYCDFCKEETEHLDGCAVCKQEMCVGRKKGHEAYSVELYRYSDGKRLAGFGSKICKDCTGKKFEGTIQEFFDGMIEKNPVV